MKDHSFTLVELLVVIAVMTILAGFIFPSLLSAREQAKKMICTNNMKQLFTLTSAYNNEFDEYYPPTADRVGGKFMAITWDELLIKYTHPNITRSIFSISAGWSKKTLSQNNIYGCPSDTLERKEDVSWKRSYAFNGGTGDASLDNSTNIDGISRHMTSVRVSDVRTPYNTALIIERTTYNNIIGYEWNAFLSVDNMKNPKNDTSLGSGVGNHGQSEFFILSYCDGAVKYDNRQVIISKMNRNKIW